MTFRRRESKITVLSENLLTTTAKGERVMNNWAKVLRQGYKRPELSDLMANGKTIDEEVKTAIDSVEEHVQNSPAIHEFLGTVIDTPLCPKVPVKTVAEYLAKMHGDFPKDDPLVCLRFMKHLMRPVFRMARDEAFNTLAMSKDLRPEESPLFILSFILAEYIDELFLGWYEKVAIPYALLSEEQKEKFRNTAGNKLDKFDYTVFDYSEANGITNRRS